MNYLDMNAWNRMVYFPQYKEILFSTMPSQFLFVMWDHFQIVQSFNFNLSNVDDIVSDDRIINNGVMGFTVTQIILSDSTCQIT